MYPNGNCFGISAQYEVRSNGLKIGTITLPINMLGGLKLIHASSDGYELYVDLADLSDKERALMANSPPK